MNAMHVPGDIIRAIAKSCIQSRDWSDPEKAFTLQSMAGVNKHWFQAMAGLKSLDFPLFPSKADFLCWFKHNHFVRNFPGSITIKPIDRPPQLCICLACKNERRRLPEKTL